MGLSVRKLFDENLKITLIIDNCQDLPNISILRALQLLVPSWNDVTKTTVANCFRKAKIPKENQNDAVADIDDPFRGLQEDLYKLRQCHRDLVPKKLIAEDVVQIDSNIITTEAPMTDEEILLSTILKGIDKEDEEDGIEVFDDAVVEPNALNALQKLCFFRGVGNDMLEFLQRFKSLHLHDAARKHSYIIIL